jgi:ketosteroid isomerase-like protein
MAQHARRMSWMTTWLVCVLVACAVPGSAQRVKSDQETLTQLERDWNAAVHRNDIEFVASILADEFVATYENGTTGDKARELALVAAFDQQIDASALEGFVIHTYRDTAVVHFTLHLIGPVKGERVELQLRYTDVWVYRDDRWLCVSSQSTRVTEPAAEP